MANPTPDEAIDECLDEMKFGARPRPVSPEALYTMRRLHWPIFQERFQEDPNAWRRDGPMVRRMSRYIGVFGRFFAETGGSWRIGVPDLMQALAIVRERCPIFLKALVRGDLPGYVYCSPDGEPPPGPPGPPPGRH